MPNLVRIFETVHFTYGKKDVMINTKKLLFINKFENDPYAKVLNTLGFYYIFLFL